MFSVRSWVRNRFLRSRFNETKRLLPIDALIERVWGRMRYKDHVCPICERHGLTRSMYVRQSRIMLEPRKPIRDDVGLKCPECQHSYHVGNPMTREEAIDEIRLRGTPFLLTPTYSVLEQNDNDVKKRIAALGYGWYD